MTHRIQSHTSTSWHDLPASIRAYLMAQESRDVAAAAAVFTDEAVVTDDSHDYRGRDAVVGWLDGPAGEYTYTTEFTRAVTLDEVRVDVEQHLEGDFPGGVVDLLYQFTMAGESISRLLIEPADAR